MRRRRRRHRRHPADRPGAGRRGVRVTSIIGGRSREWVILEHELAAAGEVVTCTDDGSYGRPGFVTQALEDVLKAGSIDAVYAVGPVPMMRAVSELTRPFGVPTTVSLNAIMVDGTGMCGGCRVISMARRSSPASTARSSTVTRSTSLLADRLATYRSFEQPALERREECMIGGRTTTRTRRVTSTPRRPPDTEPVPRHPEGTHAHRPRPMPEQDALVRNVNFSEVNLGLPEKVALLEAERCLLCPKPKCISGCPVMVNIPRFIGLLGEGDLPAAATLLDDNALPSITGRVCPQETQCEIVCMRGKKGEPVAIGYLERYVGDWAQDQHR